MINGLNLFIATNTIGHQSWFDAFQSMHEGHGFLFRTVKKGKDINNNRSDPKILMDIWINI